MIRKFSMLFIAILIICTTGASAYATDDAKTTAKETAVTGITHIQKNDEKTQIKTDTTNVTVSKTIYKFGKEKVYSRDLLFRPKTDKLKIDDLVFRPDKDKLKITNLNILSEKAIDVNKLKPNSECLTSNISE